MKSTDRISTDCENFFLIFLEPMEVERESVPNRGDILEAMATLSVHEDIYKITLSEFVTNLKKCKLNA